MSDEGFGLVTETILDHVLRIHIDRASKMNAFTPHMFDAMQEAYTRLDQDSDLWVGVVSFEGNHTTSGLDLPLFVDSMKAGERAIGSSNEVESEAPIDVFSLGRRCSKPVVMAVQGVTFTIGLEMMLASDIVVAADTCRFAQLEPRRGLGVFAGGNIRQVARAGWGNAMYHLLRADEFNSERALQLGYVQEIQPFGEHIERALEIGREIAANAPIAIQYIKKASLEFILKGEEAAIQMIPEMRRVTSNSEDAREGLESFKARRKAVFKGR